RLEPAGSVSVTVRGNNLHQLNARPGQFFRWRYLARGLWYQSHPYSLSQGADTSTIRMTAKQLGGHSRQLASLRPGTRVVLSGPFGALTGQLRSRPDALFIAAGSGIAAMVCLFD